MNALIEKKNTFELSTKLHHKSTNCILSICSAPGGMRIYFVSNSSMKEQKIASTALENNYFGRDWDYNGDNRNNDINNANRNDIFQITRVWSNNALKASCIKESMT